MSQTFSWRRTWYDLVGTDARALNNGTRVEYRARNGWLRPTDLTMVFRFLFAAAIALTMGCNATLYELPPPPPPAERDSVSLIPGEEERKKEELYLEARTRIIELYNLLNTKRYEEAARLMSLETRDFLQSLGDGAPVAEVLAMKELKLPSGKVVPFDPVSILISKDVSQLRDEVAGVEEHETGRRKEIFATLPSGQLQKIVMIAEGGQWVLHRTRIPEPFTPPE